MFTKMTLQALSLILLAGGVHLQAGEEGASQKPAGKTPPPVIKATVAGGYVDQYVAVEGTVVSAKFIPRIKGHPTFIDLEKKHPDCPFSVVVWGRSRALFTDKVETLVKGKLIRVTGKVELHKGKPQITVKKPERIAVADENGVFVPLATKPEDEEKEESQEKEKQAPAQGERKNIRG